MNVTIIPRLLQGEITPPSSKSQAHRVLIAAALAGGESRISNVTVSRDISATLSCMERFGATWVQKSPGNLTIYGLGGVTMSRRPALFCDESGSTLRFLIPISLAVAGGGEFSGRGRLMERPQTPYFDICREKNISYHMERRILHLNGDLTSGEYRLAGNVSSQFVTGLLFALPLLEGDSDIVLTSHLESKSYADMTLDALELFGMTAVETEWGYHVPGGQRYHAVSTVIEADWSQAAFFLAMAGLGSDLVLEGMNQNSHQGDRVIAPLCDRLNDGGQVIIDVSDCPDLVPALAARAALREGEVTRIINADRLRHKESDRLASVTAALNAMGAKVTEEPDRLTIEGVASLRGGTHVDACNDHRIAMMAAVAATRCEQPVTIIGAACVSKSYPDFWNVYERLGGQLHWEE